MQAAVAQPLVNQVRFKPVVEAVPIGKPMVAAGVVPGSSTPARASSAPATEVPAPVRAGDLNEPCVQKSAVARELLGRLVRNNPTPPAKVQFAPAVEVIPLPQRAPRVSPRKVIPLAVGSAVVDTTGGQPMISAVGGKQAAVGKAVQSVAPAAVLVGSNQKVVGQRIVADASVGLVPTVAAAVKAVTVSEEIGPSLEEEVAVVRGKCKLFVATTPAWVPTGETARRMASTRVVAVKRIEAQPIGFACVNRVRVPSVYSGRDGEMTATSWRDGESDLVTETLIFRAIWNGVEIRALVDSGAGTQLANGSFVHRMRVPTEPTDMTLEFADGSQASCTKRTTRQVLHIQDGHFAERFLVTEKDVPGVDIVLGMGFIRRSGANFVWPEEGTTDVPYLLFRDGTRWYGEDVIGSSGELPSIRTINAKETAAFVRSSRGALSVMAVSVEDVMTLADLSQPVQPVVTRVVPPELAVVLEEFKHIFREDLPLDLPEQRADQPNSLHHIPLIDGAQPVKVRAIPMSYGEQLLLMDLLKELLDKGYISPAPANSPWSAPIFLLKKGAGDKPGPTSARWRVITDYRALNALTKPSVYVPPSVREVIDSLVHKRVFSRSDNLSGFYQAALAVEDREKTTFTCFTPEGKRSFFFNVSCLGLQGAPSSYQLFMEDVIAGIPDVVCYIDDLAYSSNNMTEHAALLRVVFQRLSDNKVYLNAAKCQWGMESMDFLGMHISHNRVQISQDKVQGLRDYPVPRSFEEVRRFVGFANYMGQFVPNFSRSIVTITDMLKAQKEVKRAFKWNEAAQQEFDGIRQGLMDAAGLVIPDLRGDFVVETDASGLGMGAVLFQYTRSRLVPVWYMSRKFSGAEIGYNTRDREALAVVWALGKCRQYLALRPFVLYSDHESLAGFKTQPGLKGKDWRQQEYVGEFDFQQRYRKGELMVAPDALSRAFDGRVQSSSVWQEVDHELFGLPVPTLALAGTTRVTLVRTDGGRRSGAWIVNQHNARLADMASCPRPQSWRMVQQFISRVMFFANLYKGFAEEYRGKMSSVLALWRDFRRDDFRWPRSADREFRTVCYELSRKAGGGIHRNVNVTAFRDVLAQVRTVKAVVRVAPVTTVNPEVIVPLPPAFTGLDPAGVQDAYEDVLLRHGGQIEGTTLTGNWRGEVREAYAADDFYGPIVELLQQEAATLTVPQRSKIQHYKFVDAMLYFAPRGAGETRLCVPMSAGNALRLVLLYDSHETGLHGGVEKTYARLAARYFWPNMLADVRRYILTCRSCRVNKARTRSEVGVLSGLPIPAGRWEVVQMDWITDLPLTATGFNQVLVVEDRATKYSYFIPAKKTDTAEDAARRAFAVVFCVHGAPATIVSDRDRLFTSHFFGSLMALMHVKQAMGTSYYHDFNGALECLNKTVEVMLRHLLSEFPDRDFDEVLPMVQWAYNTTMHAATRQTPYYALYGVPPREPMNFMAEPGAILPPAVALFAEHQAGVLALTRDALYKAQATMLVYENRNRRDADFKQGEHVFLSTAHLGSSHFATTVGKLRERFVGPYLIIEKRADYKYRLKLPRELKDVYPVFHASLLWRAQPTPENLQGRLGAGVVFPDDQVDGEGAELLSHDDDGEPVYVIEEIVARKRANRGYQYLVKWVDFPPEENTWISRSQAVTTGAARVFDEFDARQPVVQPILVRPPAKRRGRKPQEEAVAAPAQGKAARDSRANSRRREDAQPAESAPF